MPRERDSGRRQTRYHEVHSAETRAAYRRNFFLMIAAAVGIALSFALPRMCPSEPATTASDRQAAKLQGDLESAFTGYDFDVQIVAAPGELIRCTVYVIAYQQATAPGDHITRFEKAAFNVLKDQEGEIVWRFYRKTATVGGDPAFIGLHRSDIAELAEKLGPRGKSN